MTVDQVRGHEWCRVAEDAAELAAHHAIRRCVFVTEQALFSGSDRDVHDDDPATVHVVGLAAGEAAGTVRLYPLDGGLWKGDRLAVLAAHRTGSLGGTLVRFAVATAAARGGERMIASVQAGNERFFHRLGWSSLGGPMPYLGMPHVLMEIAL